MATTPGTPSNVYVQSANQQILISWDQTAGANAYIIQRSLDNVSYTTLVTLSGTPLATQFVDTTAVLGTQYWYQVAAAGVGPAQATGSINFTGQPNPGDTASIANTIFTAVSSGATGHQFNIGGTVAITINNLSTVVASALNTIVIPTPSPTSLLLTAYQYGLEGNGLQLSSSLTNTTITPFSGGSGGSNVGAYSNPQSNVAVPTAEMTLGQIRLQAQQRADRVNSNFVTVPEWNTYINQAMFELYDLLVGVYEEFFIGTPIQFVCNGNQFIFPLPDGKTSYTSGINQTQSFIAPPFYKMTGVDLALNNATNAYVTVNKFQFSDRNRFVYPNTASTIYGVFNLQYRILGTNQIMFIPTPSGGQALRLWYIPRLQELLLDTDTTSLSISGWIEYVIVRAAKYALDKEESDTSALTQEIAFLKGRIEEMAANRDAGMPEKVSDVNYGNWANGWYGGRNGAIGGF